MYVRLDVDGHFNTIVTNVRATAKQSKVLHPYVCCNYMCCSLSQLSEITRSVNVLSQYAN